MDCDLIIRGGRVLTSAGLASLEVAVRGERIVEVAPQVRCASRARLDAGNFVVLPGGIDPHVHLGLSMKGFRSADDIRSGTEAALAGGVTTVLDFTLRRSEESLTESYQRRQAEFAGASRCDYALHANATAFPADAPAQGGEDLWKTLRRDLRGLRALGGRSLKIFTCYSREGMKIPGGILPGFLRLAAEEGFLVLCHAEEDALVEGARAALEAKGRTRAPDYPRSRPREAEARAVRAVLREARQARAAVYFVHISTAEAAGEIAAAKAEGSTAFLETCPQYLLLDDLAYSRPDGIQYTVAPPLRRETDRAALWAALDGGVVDSMGTDHCPFLSADKRGAEDDFFRAPNGLSGVETRLPLLHTYGLLQGRLSWAGLARVFSRAPAEIFGLFPRKGEIRPGADADLVLFDPEEDWILTPSALHSRADFTPYSGMRARGRVRAVFLRGRKVFPLEEPQEAARGLDMAPGKRGTG